MLADPICIQVVAEMPYDCEPDELIGAIQEASIGLSGCRVDTDIRWGETCHIILSGWREASAPEVARLRAFQQKIEDAERAQYEVLREKFKTP